MITNEHADHGPRVPGPLAGAPTGAGVATLDTPLIQQTKAEIRTIAADIAELAQRFATEVTAPIVIDSTEPEVMQAAHERIGGRGLDGGDPLDEFLGAGHSVGGRRHREA